MYQYSGGGTFVTHRGTRVLNLLSKYFVSYLDPALSRTTVRMLGPTADHNEEEARRVELEAS